VLWSATSESCRAANAAPCAGGVPCRLALAIARQRAAVAAVAAVAVLSVVAEPRCKTARCVYLVRLIAPVAVLVRALHGLMRVHIICAQPTGVSGSRSRVVVLQTSGPSETAAGHSRPHCEHPNPSEALQRVLLLPVQAVLTAWIPLRPRSPAVLPTELHSSLLLSPQSLFRCASRPSSVHLLPSSSPAANLEILAVARPAPWVRIEVSIG